MTVQQLREEIKAAVERGEMDEDILVVIENCKTEEEVEEVLEEYT